MMAMSERMKSSNAEVSDTAIQLLMRVDDLKKIIDADYEATMPVDAAETPCRDSVCSG